MLMKKMSINLIIEQWNHSRIIQKSNQNYSELFYYVFLIRAWDNKDTYLEDATILDVWSNFCPEQWKLSVALTFNVIWNQNKLKMFLFLDFLARRPLARRAELLKTAFTEAQMAVIYKLCRTRKIYKPCGSWFLVLMYFTNFCDEFLRRIFATNFCDEFLRRIFL